MKSFLYTFAVALRTEGVDRNQQTGVQLVDGVIVALRTEGVDRNFYCCSCLTAWSMVALRTEGVDRNYLRLTVDCNQISRPPHGGRG